ncbi:hypothetical protein ACIHFB_06810 [Streptomyces sp. NPDC051963]|uniref:hypothetical protein n=1 Tax=Streptomyces sp. NPDC051963 TaxID=3365678 RepID=UPI0037D368BE
MAAKRPGKYHHFVDGEIHELTDQEIWELIRGDYQDLKVVLRAYAKRHGLTLSVVRIPDDGLRFRMHEEGDDLSAYLPPELLEREEGLWLTTPRRSATVHAECDHPKTSRQRQLCRALRPTDTP